MVAVAGGVHGSEYRDLRALNMEAMEQRITTMEKAIRLIPEDIIEYWPHVRNAIKDMNNQIQNIHTTIDDNDESNKAEAKGMKDLMEKENETIMKMTVKAAEVNKAMARAEQMIQDINKDKEDIRKCLNEEINVLQRKMNDRTEARGEGPEEKDKARDWNEKIKRADFSKPENGGGYEKGLYV